MGSRAAQPDYQMAVAVDPVVRFGASFIVAMTNLRHVVFTFSPHAEVQLRMEFHVQDRGPDPRLPFLEIPGALDLEVVRDICNVLVGSDDAIAVRDKGTRRSRVDRFAHHRSSVPGVACVSGVPGVPRVSGVASIGYRHLALTQLSADGFAALRSLNPIESHR